MKMLCDDQNYKKPGVELAKAAVINIGCHIKHEGKDGENGKRIMKINSRKMKSPGEYREEIAM